MGVKIDKYVDLLNRYAIYGENGYFIDPFIINTILVDELKLHMSFSEMEKFVNEAGITITEDEIKMFLDKKMDEEEPTLREEIEKAYKPISNNPAKWTDEDIKRESRRFGLSILRTRYQFEPYSLKYFKIYTSILKKIGKTLFSVLEDLGKCKSGELTKEAKQRFLDLDFHISNGDIYITDAERLADAIIYNFKDLYEKIKQGNNPETYLSFKESKHSFMKDGIMEGELYPSEEIQTRDSHHSYQPQFIALSDVQKEQIRKEELENISRFLEQEFLEDDYEEEKSQLVKKVTKSN